MDPYLLMTKKEAPPSPWSRRELHSLHFSVVRGWSRGSETYLKSYLAHCGDGRAASAVGSDDGF